jgi:hypothetical protein
VFDQPATNIVEGKSMKTLIHALVLGVFATAASAQTAAPPTDTKAKQETVKAATEKTTGYSGKAAAEGSAKAAATKDAPKALPPDKQVKQEAVKGATEKTTGYSGKAAAEGSAKAAADKTPRAPPPKMSEHEEALKKAAKK